MISLPTILPPVAFIKHDIEISKQNEVTGKATSLLQDDNGHCYSKEEQDLPHLELALQEKIDLLAGLMLDKFFEDVEKGISKKGAPKYE